MTTAIGALTLGEMLFGWNLGIDQMLFRDEEAYSPGRMAPSAAFCFLLTGALLWAAAWPIKKRLKLPFLEALGVTVLVAGGFAVAGYLLEAIFGFRWWNNTGMAVNTAVGFLYWAAARWPWSAAKAG